jgi:Peroxiredoxin
MALKIGDFAPDFKLLNQNGEHVSLSDFKGKKVVILFFPMANTGVCTKEMCSISNDYAKYANLDAEVLGISVDSHFALKLWADANNIKITLLSDFNKEVAPKYGSFYDVFVPGKLDYKGVAKRSAFVVDKEGKIIHSEVLEVAGNEPDYNAIEEALKK